MLGDTLVVIPAREGSKGIPHKNIKALNGKPLIHYSIESARRFFADEDICVTTDGEQTKSVAAQTGLKVPFLRPSSLATDTAGTYEVLLHALKFYEDKGKRYSKILLLQPTSPFRCAEHFTGIFNSFDEELEMAVSVGLSHHNPYFNLFEESAEGYLVKSKTGAFERRQDCPAAYFFNGSMYLIKTDVLKQKPMSAFTQVRKYVMDEKYCIDIDTPMDWMICEALLEKGVYNEIC
jgi:CMP-N,N'-diacetyllegionaminic acid synthase